MATENNLRDIKDTVLHVSTTCITYMIYALMGNIIM